MVLITTFPLSLCPEVVLWPTTDVYYDVFMTKSKACHLTDVVNVFDLYSIMKMLQLSEQFHRFCWMVGNSCYQTLCKPHDDCMSSLRMIHYSRTLPSFKVHSFKTEKTRPSVLKREKTSLNGKGDLLHHLAWLPCGFDASSHFQILGSGLSHDVTGMTHIAVIPHNSTD